MIYRDDDTYIQKRRERKRRKGGLRREEKKKTEWESLDNTTVKQKSENDSPIHI